MNVVMITLAAIRLVWTPKGPMFACVILAFDSTTISIVVGMLMSVKLTMEAVKKPVRIQKGVLCVSVEKVSI